MTAQRRWADLGETFDGPHATPTRRDEGPYFLNIASLNSGRLDLSASDHVAPEDFAKWTKRVTPRAGDLLFSYETRLGEAALMPEGIEACLGRRMALLRPDRTVVDPGFLLYFYLSPEFQRTIAERTIHGATVPRILLSEMPSWPVQIPSLAVQRAIADVLGALDDKIAANTRLVDLTRKLLTARFARLGIDESPDFDSHAVYVEDLIQLNPKVPKPESSTAVYLEMKNVPEQEMTVHSWSSREPKGGVRFQNGDTVMARITPCLQNGKTAYIDFLDGNEVGVGSTEYIVMRAQPGVPTALPYFLAKSPRFRERAIRSMIGTSGRQRLAAKDVAPHQVSLPDQEQLDEFGAISSIMMRRVKGAVDESRSLAATRDALLPHLMSGRVTVKDAESVVEGVA